MNVGYCSVSEIISAWLENYLIPLNFLIMDVKKLLSSDGLRLMQFSCNSVQKRVNLISA